MREVVRGLAAAAAALLAMAGVAAAGLLLLGAGGLTAPVIALAVGGSVDLQAAPVGGLPVGVRGGLRGIPLGVSLAGAVVLGWLLLRRREGLLVRGAVAGVAFAGVLGGVALWAGGKVGLPGGVGAPRGCASTRLPFPGSSAGVRESLPGGLGNGSSGGMSQSLPAGLGNGSSGAVSPTLPAGLSTGPSSGVSQILPGGLGTGPSVGASQPLPGGLGAGLPAQGGLPSPAHLEAAFSVAVGPTVAGAAVWALVVVAVCWLIARFPSAATTLRALRRPLAGLVAVCLIAAGALGGPAAAGAVLLLLPQLIAAAVLTGLGVPWHLSTTGLLSCTPDTSFPATHWIAGAVLLGCGIAIAVRRRRPPLRQAAELAAVVGGVLGVTALLSRFSVDLSVTAFGFSIPVLGAQLAANPLLALAAGAVGGAVAGFAGSLLVRTISVSSRAWTR
ncbi:streptophobe family protein [Amycolatopsis kentuckyensis]|uniref:streptophobe family protein n=1 Tax=Amycolatopsis kentuckyensis TaxID=218823 RepID=UPI003563F0AC